MRLGEGHLIARDSEHGLDQGQIPAGQRAEARDRVHRDRGQRQGIAQVGVGVIGQHVEQGAGGVFRGGAAVRLAGRPVIGAGHGDRRGPGFDNRARLDVERQGQDNGFSRSQPIEIGRVVGDFAIEAQVEQRRQSRSHGGCRSGDTRECHARRHIADCVHFVGFIGVRDLDQIGQSHGDRRAGVFRHGVRVRHGDDRRVVGAGDRHRHLALDAARFPVRHGDREGQRQRLVRREEVQVHIRCRIGPVHGQRVGAAVIGLPGQIQPRRISERRDGGVRRFRQKGGELATAPDDRGICGRGGQDIGAIEIRGLEAARARHRLNPRGPLGHGRLVGAADRKRRRVVGAGHIDRHRRGVAAAGAVGQCQRVGQSQDLAHCQIVEGLVRSREGPAQGAAAGAVGLGDGRAQQGNQRLVAQREARGDARSRNGDAAYRVFINGIVQVDVAELQRTRGGQGRGRTRDVLDLGQIRAVPTHDQGFIVGASDGDGHGSRRNTSVFVIDADGVNLRQHFTFGQELHSRVIDHEAPVQDSGLAVRGLRCRDDVKGPQFRTMTAASQHKSVNVGIGQVEIGELDAAGR